jgi:ABC-type branched-subunit amino acid transport system ATPase component
MTIALETVNLEKSFGGLRVTRDLSLKIEAGARHALIGPNGAGKTTVINLLTGVLKPNSGRILLEGSDITGLPVHKRVLRGLSRTFQINQLYPDMTPLETVGLAVSEHLGHRAISSARCHERAYSDIALWQAAPVGNCGGDCDKAARAVA